MREQLEQVEERLVAAVRAHAAAVRTGTRPDVPDPLPAATGELAAALQAYAQVLDEHAGVLVPLRFELEEAEEPGIDLTARLHAALANGHPSQPPPGRDGLDWAGDVERLR